MKSFRLGITLAAGAALLAGMSACANPTAGGANAAAKDVGTAVAIVKDDSIAAMVPEALRAKGSFTVAVNPDIAPVKFLDSDGKVAGLNPELLKAAGTVMGLDVTMQQATFDALVPGLEAKRFEVIASIGDFKERQGKIDFIDYLKTGSALIVAAGYEKDALELSELCGLKLGYVRGTFQQGQIEGVTKDCAAGGKEPVEGIGFGDANAALLSVKSGQAVGFWGDIQSLLYNAKTNPDVYKVVSDEVAGPYGIGVNKDDAEFRDALRAALLSLVESGAYGQMLEKWGQQDLGMPELPLNTGASLKG